MKNKVFKKTIAAALALTLMGGGLPTAIAGTNIFEPGIIANAEGTLIATGNVYYLGDTIDFGSDDVYVKILNSVDNYADRTFKLAEEFVNSQDRRPQLFYVWGHSYEFDRDDNWDVIEEFLYYMDEHRDEIWFAGNGEILAYLEAYKRLEYSADGSMIYNPSALDVEIATSLTAKELLKSGQVTRIKETVL